MPSDCVLPDDIVVFERGWLSSNNILLLSSSGGCLVDSGYTTHSDQTLDLVSSTLGARPLELLLNTHLHSDHCGGNARLQAYYPGVKTHIPAGQADLVRHWDPYALSYEPTGQSCDPFSFDGTLNAGDRLLIGAREWQLHAAPGHDPHSVILFEPHLRLLISADALWETGFGVVFPELEGIHAFDEVASTLDLIESLQPKLVIPGHGPVFHDVQAALRSARQRLAHFVADPRRHARHAAKVLLKFKLLEVQRVAQGDFYSWCAQTSYLQLLHGAHFKSLNFQAWIAELLEDLIRVGAARQEEQLLFNR